MAHTLYLYYSIQCPIYFNMCARSPQKCIDPFDVFLLPGNSWQWFFRPDSSCRKACRKCMRIMVQVVATQIICLFSSRTLGKNDPIWLAHIFEMGWFNHPFCLLKFEQDRCPDACWWDERYIYLPEKSSVFFSEIWSPQKIIKNRPRTWNWTILEGLYPCIHLFSPQNKQWNCGPKCQFLSKFVDFTAAHIFKFGYLGISWSKVVICFTTTQL